MKRRIPTFVARTREFFFCKGAARYAINPDPVPANVREDHHLTPTQDAWMRENKPLYHTGIAINDLPHLPQHLRHV